MIHNGILFGVEKITLDPWGRLVQKGTFKLECNGQLSNELVKFERAEYGYTDNSRTGVCYKRLS